MTSDSGSRSESRDVKQARPEGRQSGPKGIAQKLKMLIGQYKLSKDVSLRRKLIGVEYEKRRNAQLGRPGYRRRAGGLRPEPTTLSQPKALIADAGGRA